MVTVYMDNGQLCEMLFVVRLSWYKYFAFVKRNGHQGVSADIVWFAKSHSTGLHLQQMKTLKHWKVQ